MDKKQINTCGKGVILKKHIAVFVLNTFLCMWSLIAIHSSKTAELLPLSKNHYTSIFIFTIVIYYGFCVMSACAYSEYVDYKAGHKFQSNRVVEAHEKKLVKTASSMNLLGGDVKVSDLPTVIQGSHISYVIPVPIPFFLKTKKELAEERRQKKLLLIAEHKERMKENSLENVFFKNKLCMGSKAKAKATRTTFESAIDIVPKVYSDSPTEQYLEDKKYVRNFMMNRPAMPPPRTKGAWVDYCDVSSGSERSTELERMTRELNNPPTVTFYPEYKPTEHELDTKRNVKVNELNDVEIRRSIYESLRIDINS